jgi:hypothetical protein
MDWIMRPWVRGKSVSYESLKDGTLDLFDIALMNDAIDISDENERRAIAAQTRR